MNFLQALQDALAVVIAFVPLALLFLLILIVGLIVAKLISKGLEKLLEKVGFDRLVERGGIKKALAKSKLDASDIVGKIVYYTLVLFVLPFGLFGFIFSSNPDYIKPMFGSGLGQVMLGAAGLMLAAGGLWLKKLVNPEF